ncbi:MAG: RHS repeat-associated core domain-containing protein, partial [Pseudomonadota bacterium]
RPIMATDATGAVVWQASYTPFGGIRQVSVDTGALSAQEHRFPGQWFQAETGYHQNWHRDYDPTIGRYLQADPLGLIDGASVYNYALQNPLRYTDPRGLQVVSPPVTTVPEAPPIVDDIARVCGSLARNALKGLGLTLSLILAPSEACGCGDDDDCFEDYQIEQDNCDNRFENRLISNLPACLDRARNRYILCRGGVPKNDWPDEWTSDSEFDMRFGPNTKPRG